MAATTPRYFALFAAITFQSFVPFAFAQGQPTTSAPTDVQADSGTRPNGAYDGLNDNVNLTNGNLSFCIPLVSLPGPVMPPGEPKLDLNLPLCYNSEFITAIGPTPGYGYGPLLTWNPFGTLGMGYGWTLSGHPGVWDYTQGTGVGTGSYAITATGYPEGFMPDGGRFSPLGFDPPTVDGPFGADTGGEGLYYVQWPSGPLYLKNGIKVTPTALGQPGPEAETDTLGHTITWGANTITDAAGRTVTVNNNSSSNPTGVVITYPDPSATSQSQTRTVTIQLETVAYQSSCAFSGFLNISTPWSSLVPSAATLPNGLQYTFYYDNCSELRLVQYPSGGYTRYDYQSGQLGVGTGNYGYAYTYPILEIYHRYVCPVPASTVNATASTCPVPEEVTTYTPSLGDFNNAQMTVQDPVGNSTVYQFAQPNPQPNIQSQAVETQRQLYDASGKLWKTVTTQYLSTSNETSSTCANLSTIQQNETYGNNVPTLPTLQTTTLDNGMTAEIQWTYYCNPTWNGPTELTEKREYDYGPSGTPGALLKRTDYDWLQLDGYAAYYLWPQPSGIGANILDRKTSETVYDGSGRMMEQTAYQYDYGNPASYGALGLLTQVNKWAGGSLSNVFTTSYQQTGTGYTATYPTGRQVTYNFTDNYVGGQSLTNSNGFPYDAYPTTITTTANGKSYVEQNQYFWGGGLVAASCGDNYSGTCATGKSGVPDYSTYTYDLMGRQTSVTTGDGGNTTTCYSDDPGTACASEPPYETVTTELVQSGVSKVSTAISMYKGSSGAPTTTTQINSDPSCSGGTVNVDTTYDLDRRKSTVSNPYCTSSPNASTSGTTTYSYDGLSRVTQITNPDGTSSTNTYTGRAVLSSDEGNGTRSIERISQSDALGRLIFVCELTSTTEVGDSATPASCGSSPTIDISGTGFLTTYSYDLSAALGPLENVMGVAQGDEGRSFTYDSLGDLVTASNPESGLTRYTSYDGDGNLLSKTDANGITTTYTWDQLDRLTSKTYSDGVTPSACFQYDQSNAAYGYGRLTSEWTQSGSCPSSVPTGGAITDRSFTYDLMGRVATDKQCTLIENCGTESPSAVVSYQHDYAGDLSQVSDSIDNMPFGYTYNSADRLSTMTGPGSSGTFDLLSSTNYSPAGALAGAQVGSNITLTRTYNSRLLPTSETDVAGITPGTATLGVSGVENTYIQAIGAVKFSGSEQSKVENGQTVYDDGDIEVQLGGQQPFQIQYSEGSTPQSIAAAFANEWLGSCSSGTAWGGYASGATAYITSCTPTTSFTISASVVGCAFSSTGCSFGVGVGGANATVTISETTGTLTDGGIVMGVFAASGGAPVQEASVDWVSSSTASSLAAALATSFGSCSTNGNVVSATANGPTVTLIGCTSGKEYTAEQIGGGCDCGSGIASFSASVSGIVYGDYVYDSGTATLKVDNTQIASTTWGSGSTDASIDQALASAASSNSLFSVSYNNGINVTAYDDGSTNTDYSYALTTTDTSGLSVSPSFEGTSGTLQGSTDATIYSWSIPSSGGYAPNGDVLSMTDSVMGTWGYSYDDLNRLSNATVSAGSDNGMTLEWSYDRYGNRWSQTATGTGGGAATQPELSFNLNNQIAGAPSGCTGTQTYCYNGDGNLLNDGLNQYSYDAEGRISSIINGGVGYVYDAEGNRVAKLNSSGTATSVYILTAGNQQMAELDSGTWAHTNIYAPGGRLLATYDSSSQPSPGYHYNLTDWLGTKRMQTTSGGNQQETCLSNPFGDGLSCSGGVDATEQHFTGKDRDAESGLDYFYARYYSSMLGRFMTPDWAGKPTAVPYASFGDPQSLNLYAYVRNNPITGIDTDGHVNPQGCEAYCEDQAETPIGLVDPENMTWSQQNQEYIDSYWEGQFAAALAAPPTPPGDPGSAQQLAWSSLSGGQQALVSGGEKSWNALSADAQDNFAAVTHALEGVTLSGGATGLSEVQSASMRGNGREVDVVWKAGAADAFKATGKFSETTILPTHFGAQVLRQKGVGAVGQGIELIFPTQTRQESQAHIDYNSLLGGHHFDADNDDVAEHKEVYKQLYGPLPGLIP